MKRLQNFVASTTVEDRVSLENNISELEIQLNQLRDKLSSNEERHQKQLTMLGALGSAIEQVCNAIKLCEDGGEPGLVDTFWEELEDIQSGDYVFTKALPQHVDSNEENERIASMKLSEIKEYATELGLTNNYVKTFGSVRSKTTWIDAINTFRLEDSNGNEESNSDQSSIKVNPNNSDNIIDVSHNAVHDSENSYEVKDNEDSTELIGSDDSVDTDEWSVTGYTGTSNSEQSKLNQVEDW